MSSQTVNTSSTDQSLILMIDGMSCAGCVRSVESALAGVSGVSDAKVNFASQSALVRGSVEADALIEAVSLVGYQARERSDNLFHSEAAVTRDRMWDSLSRSGSALVFGLVLMSNMQSDLLPEQSNVIAWAVIGCAVAVVLWMAGGHFYRGAWNGIRHGEVTMDTLVALGTGSAWLYSMVVVLKPDWLPIESRHHFFEAALFVVGFVGAGKALESNARSRASAAIEKLFDLTPSETIRVSDKGEETIPVELVEPLDQLKVKPGQLVPVDGAIIEGSSLLDESSLTGESLPVARSPGELVRAGTTNIDGVLIVEARAVGAQTVIARVASLVQQAQNSKPRIGTLVDRISAIFVPIVILLACCTAVVWLLLDAEPSFALATAVSVLIIACPCALGLAVPMTIMIATGRAAENGLLIKDGEVLERTRDVTLLTIDKTGTLTEGMPEVCENQDLSPEELAVVMALVGASDHPLAMAAHQYCQLDGVTSANVEVSEHRVGGGILGIYQNSSVMIGSTAMLQTEGFEVAELKRSGFWFVCDGEVKGALLFQDKIRAEAADELARLKSYGVTAVMLTGDNQFVAESVATQVGIDQVHAGCLPEDKLRLIEQFREKGHCVAYVGDGINDAAALAAADVGIAMGQGADIAVEAADAVLLSGSIQGVGDLIDLSKRSIRNMYQNLTGAFIYNIALIPVAAGVLFPFTGILINPGLAGFAMALSSVSVVLSSLRLKV